MVHINSVVHILDDEDNAVQRQINKIRENRKDVMTIDVKTKNPDWTKYEMLAVETHHNCFVYTFQFENAKGHTSEVSVLDSCRVLTKVRGLIPVSELNALDVLVDDTGTLTRLTHGGREHRNKFTAVAFVMDRQHYGKCVYVNSIPFLFE